MKLKGLVFNSKKLDSSGKPEVVPFTKVYISDEYGYITPKKLGTFTLINGTFELNLPVQVANGIPIPLIDGKFITAIVGNKRVILPLTGTDTYNFDAKETEVLSWAEVTVTANKPKQTPPPQKKYTPFIVAGSVLLLGVIGVAIYIKYNK